MSSSTTSSSSTKTKTIPGKNPPGQPPGFTLPTYVPPKPSTTSAAPTALPSGTGTLPLDEMMVSQRECMVIDNWVHDPPKEEYIKQLTDKCSTITEVLGVADEPIHWKVGTKIDAEIRWQEGCAGAGIEQNPRYPMEGYDCETLMRDNFKFEDCDEPVRGYGGYRIVGCLRYTAWMHNQNLD
ncbi:hypothetical protein BDW62DRAFT_184381 [Aspergillus aurantiobrunneus]